MPRHPINRDEILVVIHIGEDGGFHQEMPTGIPLDTVTCLEHMTQFYTADKAYRVCPNDGRCEDITEDLAQAWMGRNPDLLWQYSEGGSDLIPAFVKNSEAFEDRPISTYERREAAADRAVDLMREAV